MPEADPKDPSVAPGLARPSPAMMRMSSFGNDEELAHELPPPGFLKTFQDKLKIAFDEYFLALVVDDTVARIKELLAEWPSQADEVGVLAVRAALDRDEAKRGALVELLSALHQSMVLDRAALIRSFEKLFCTWEDIAIDVPKAPEAILGILHGLISSEVLERSLLTKLPESLLNAGLDIAGPAFSGMLNCIVAELKEFKLQVARTLEEYFVALDANEVGTFLKELDRRAYHHEFVKKAITLSFFRDDKEAVRDSVFSLMTQLTSVGILSKDDLQWGVTRLLGQLDDLALDCPRSSELTIEFLALMVAGELVSVPFLRWCRQLRIGGATGLKVLKQVQRKTPEYSKRHLETKEFKGEIQSMILEYFNSGDESEFGSCVRELAPLAPDRSAELVRKLMVLAMERSPSECDMATRLLVWLSRNEELDVDSIERGFDDLFAKLPEIALDVPAAKDLANSFVKEAKYAKIVGLDWPYADPEATM